MRIGIFTNCYHPLVNGVVGAVSLLRKGFLEEGHEVYIFTPAVDDYQDTEGGIFRFPAVDLTWKVKYPVAVPFSPRMARVLKGLKLDIIHTHHPFVLGPYALTIARRQNIPHVFTFHTQYDQYTHYVPLPGSLVRFYVKNKVRYFSQAVNRITTPAESACRVLQSYGITHPIEVIPNPVDLKRFRESSGEAIRTKYHLNAEKLLINIGRIAPEKNLGLLLNTFKYMLEKAPFQSLKLMIVGGGQELANLKRQAESLEIQDHVIFTGLIDAEFIPQYLAAADVFVMTSTTEVKPLSQLEALAAGLPVVSVAAAGANDTIIQGKNGLLVSLDAGELGDAVLNLIFDQERYDQFKKNARQTAIGYEYSTITSTYLGLFERVILEYQMNRRRSE